MNALLYHFWKFILVRVHFNSVEKSQLRYALILRFIPDRKNVLVRFEYPTF